MMRRAMRLVGWLLILSFGAAAQEAEWPVVERCMGEFVYPSIPPSRWDFEGTIVSVNDEGVRAIRVDEPQQVILSLSSEHSFPVAGGFSPDGRWFAWPTGGSQHGNMISRIYSIDAIAVISTDGRENLQVEWEDYYGYHDDPDSLPQVV